MLEIWKSLKYVVECGDNYEVSNLGNIRSVDGIVLNPWSDKDGYLRVLLYYKQARKHYGVHRLIAISFLENPENKPQVNHLDGNKSHNHVENLAWVTARENQQHALSTGLRKSVKGEKHSNSKLSDDKVVEIINLYKTNDYSLQQLVDMFDSSLGVVSSIISRKSWKHIDIEGHKRDMSKNSIITEELIERVKSLNKEGLSKRKIGLEVGVSRTTVTKILDNY